MYYKILNYRTDKYQYGGKRKNYTIWENKSKRSGLHGTKKFPAGN